MYTEVPAIIVIIPLAIFAIVTYILYLINPDLVIDDTEEVQKV